MGQSITVRVKEEGCVETVVDELDLTQPAVTREVEAQKGAAVELEVSAALAEARALNAGVFGFGEAIHRKSPKEWRRLEHEWDSVFPTLKVMGWSRRKSGTQAVSTGRLRRRYAEHQAPRRISVIVTGCSTRAGNRLADLVRSVDLAVVEAGEDLVAAVEEVHSHRPEDWPGPGGRHLPGDARRLGLRVRGEIGPPVPSAAVPLWRDPTRCLGRRTKAKAQTQRSTASP